MELIPNLFLLLLFFTLTLFGQSWTHEQNEKELDVVGTSPAEESQSHHQSFQLEKQKENCTKVNCTETAAEEEEEFECPDDSHRIPPSPTVIHSTVESVHDEGDSNGNVISAIGTVRCQCNPLNSCRQPQCKPGLVELVVTVVRNGTGIPGTCCPVYECRKRKDESNGEGDCIYEGKIYKSGESWTHFAYCHQCNCQNGVSACIPINCPIIPTDCNRVIVRPINNINHNDNDPMSCCPICAGCISDTTGQMFNHSDIWEEDACTTCRCVEGRKQCHSMTCHANCLQPKFVEGECCPQCDDDDENEHTSSHRCSSTLNCPVQTIECEHGRKLDSNGCPSCECNQCPSLTNCTKTCLLGYEIDESGCASCECIIQQSPSRFHLHNSCDLHENDGKEWFDGCRSCICKHGVQMCSLLRCPGLACEPAEYIEHEGRCCPTCASNVEEKTEETNFDLSRIGTFISCLPSKDDDSVHFEGDNWSSSSSPSHCFGSCLNCTCHKGQILCASPKCPTRTTTNQDQKSHVVVVAEEEKVADGCCALCPDENELGTLSAAVRDKEEEGLSSCFSKDTETIYQSGEMWKVGIDNCLNCICTNGRIDCISSRAKCSKPQCENPVFVKSHCCPICLDFGHSIENQQHDKDKDTTNDQISTRKLETHCILLIVSLFLVILILSAFILRNWLLRKRQRQHMIKSSSALLHSPALLPPPTPPVTPNYSCCYKYYPNRGQLSEQKTPLCSSAYSAAMVKNQQQQHGIGESASERNMEKV